MLCRLFFVIEFVNGGDLMFHMQNKRKLPEDHARFYISQICLAFHFLHDKGKHWITNLDQIVLKTLF